MKRYLNKNTIKILITFLLVGFSFSFFKPQAQNKLEYYKELFGNKFGFKIFESDKEKVLKKDYLSSNPDKGYAVVLSSMISTFQKKTILICDDEFSTDHPFKFSCSSDFISSEDAYEIGGILRGPNPEIADFYVIPEKILLTPDKRSDVSNFFKAIARSDKALESSYSSLKDEENKSVFSELMKFKDTIVFEFFSIAFYMLLLVTLSWGPLSYLGREDRKFNLRDIRNLFNSVNNVYLYQKILFPVLSFMILIYISIVLIINIIDGQGISFSNLASTILENFNISQLKQFIETKNIIRLGLFAYGIVFVGFIFILLLPPIVKVFKRAGYKISESKVKPEVIEYSLPSLIILSLITPSFFGIGSSVKLLGFLILLIIFLFVKNTLSKNFNYYYSLKEKIAFLLIGVLIFTAGFLFKFREEKIGHTFKTEDLIGVTDQVVFLPYSKQLGKDTLIKQYSFSGSEPVFVDNYLVYTPNNSRIENKNAMDFKNEGIFYIQRGDVDDIVTAIYSNENLSDRLLSEDPSNLIKIKNFKKNENGTDPEIQITFSCKRQDLGNDKIKANFYYLDDSDEIQKENKSLLYFAGCLKLGESETLKVNLALPDTKSEFMFVSLADVFGSDIEKIQIIDKGEFIEPEYFSTGEGYRVIASGGLTDSAILPVTNYIFGDSYTLSFDLNLDEEGKFDISVPINELIKEGMLKDRFLIWSTKKYLPVRLP